MIIYCSEVCECMIVRMIVESDKLVLSAIDSKGVVVLDMPVDNKSDMSVKYNDGTMSIAKTQVENF